jgi:hypothetical protein
MKRLLIRAAVALVLLEVLYLAAANLALNLPATRNYLSSIHPDQYVYHWGRAWSWHPFRIHATDFSANGQTRTQQWQVSAPAISASIAIVPLFDKTLHFHNLQTADIDVRVRPRPSPERDPAAAAFYPEIEGRNPNLPAETTIPEQTPGWKLVFDVNRIGGENDVWVWQNQATLAGTGRATIVHQGRHGPLTISGGMLDATIKSLTVRGEQVSETGSIKGTFDFATFLPQQHRGLKSLAFMTTEADIDLSIGNLDFMNDFLRRVSGLVVGGKGGLKGHIAYTKGNLVPGTKLAITADALQADQAPYSGVGAGDVGISVDAAASDTLKADFHFETVSVLHEPEQQTLFSGSDLQIVVERTAWILPGSKEERVPRRIAATLPKVTVPDLAAYQRYIPEKWNLQVLGGSGSLEGQAEISSATVDLDLLLRSQDANIKFKDDAFETDLVMGIKAKGTATDETAEVDVSGTYLELDDSHVSAKGRDFKPWQARLAVTKGEGNFALPTEADATKNFPGFWGLVGEKNFKSILATADGNIQAGLSVSDLNWVNLLFKNPYALAIYNSAEVVADLTIKSGWLAKGSTVKMSPRDFKMEFLDYVAEGRGGFDLAVEAGGEEPDIRLDAKLADASLRLQDESKAVINEMTLAVTVRAEKVGLKAGGTVNSLDLSIPSAKVTDMASYNVYIPRGAPLRILSGKGAFSATIKMRDDVVGGAVKMQTSRVGIYIDGQKISGTVTADIPIKGGSAKSRTFEIAGSSIAIDGVAVAGDPATKGNWNARLDIRKGSVVWKRPITLDVSLAIRMTDTRPLIAIFETQRKTHKWLEKFLTLKDVHGTATVKVKPEQFLIPYAMFNSDTMEIGAKGLIRPQNRQGLFYARLGNVAGIVAVDNKERKFGLLGATRKFEDYVPGGPLPGINDPAVPVPAASKKSPFSIFKRK